MGLGKRKKEREGETRSSSGNSSSNVSVVLVGGASRIKNAKSRPDKNCAEHSRKLLPGEMCLLESARGKRIATENGARNNPRRNNATRQIVSTEISIPIYVPLKVRRLYTARRGRGISERRRLFATSQINFSGTPLRNLSRRNYVSRGEV